MIVDSIDNLGHYKQVIPQIERICSLVNSGKLASCPAGRMDFTDDGFYVNIDECELKPSSQARLEVHDKFIDIQIALTSEELIGWRPRQQLKTLAEAHADRDIAFYNDEPLMNITLRPGYFAIFFPWDGHAPLIGSGKTRKAIFKVKV